MLDKESVQQQAFFSAGHCDEISSIKFPPNYTQVFATSSQDEIRLWSPVTQKELLRIELMQGSEFDFAKANAV